MCPIANHVSICIHIFLHVGVIKPCDEPEASANFSVLALDFCKVYKGMN